MLETPWMFFVIVIVVLIVLVTTFRNQGRGDSARAQRMCEGCGLPNPGIANYCRRCGKKM